jgi:hypothetical protein
MTRLRHARARLVSRAGAIAAAIGRPLRTVAAWWSSLDATERVMYRGLVLLAAGLALVWVPAALIVTGAVLTAVSLGFTLRRGA